MSNRGGVVSHLRSAAALSAVGITVCAPAAFADRVYHSEHLPLAPVAGAPLRSGFVENTKAEGPQRYAHEVFVLNGAQPGVTYTVTRHFYYYAPELQVPRLCEGVPFDQDVATLRTNGAGNARGDAVVRPEQVAGFEGVQAVSWSMRVAQGAPVYRTACTVVTID
jgi:hypothetical protein